MKINKFALFVWLGFSLISKIGLAASLPDSVAKALDSYNVVWDSPSKNSSDSMPCGGHDVGLNVWVENGDLLFYMSRSGTFDENNSMLKLGRVRIKMTPNPFAPGGTFRQELKLKEGYVEITGKSGDASATVKIWAEVARPVVHVDVHGDQPLEVESWYESWRTADHPLSEAERFQCFSFARTSPKQFPVITHADTIEPGDDQVLWYHRNDNSDSVIGKLLTFEHLESVKSQFLDTVKDNTFGGVMKGQGFVSAGQPVQGTYATTPFTAWGIKTKSPETDAALRIYFHTEQAATIDLWKQHLAKLSDATDVSDDAAWKNDLTWWSDFWNRSHIFINADNPNPQDAAWVVGKNYQLFRYTLGCNAYGDYPSKFNGSLFTFDPQYVAGKHPGGVGSTPDFRAWGGGSFTAQNQRLLYWPMLKSGDFDMMKPQFDFYARCRSNAELVTKVYWNHEGGCFPEQIENFGLCVGECYEWGWGKRGLGPRPGDDIAEFRNPSAGDLYDTVFEFCGMILDTRSYAGADITPYIPLLDSCVTFFDQHYRAENKKNTGQELDPQGHLVLFPSTANETYKTAANPSNVIAALRTVLTGMVALPPTYGTSEQRRNWERMLAEVPPLPALRNKDGHEVIAPAEKWGKIANQDFSQMYLVFPWHVYGLGKPDLQVGRDTWEFGADKPDQKGTSGWHQSPIFVADLGLTDQAEKMVSEKFADAKPRFPTFWGPNFDYTPDFNAAGSTMIALQEMLLQTNGSKIYLAPAWPKEWAADFKLHAPGQTTVEGQIRNGACENLKVSPPSRAADVSCGAPPETPAK